MAVGKERICEALMRVASRKPLAKVSVVDIISEAEISRSSFYYHFHDVPDVIDYMYDFFASKSREIFTGLNQGNNVSPEVMLSHAYERAEGMFREIYDNREMFLFLRDKADRQEFYDRIIEGAAAAHRQFIYYFELPDGSFYTLPSHELDYFIRRRAYQHLSTLDTWAQRGFSDSPEYMVRLFHYLPFLEWERVDMLRNYPRIYSRGTLDMEQVQEIRRKTNAENSQEEMS